MTNTYGTEPPEHDHEHEEARVQEQDEVHEAPSDYEFADDVQEAIVEDEHTGEEAAMPAESKPTQRSFLPIAGAIGGLLLLGAVAWWQFGTSGSSVPPPMVSEPGAIAPLSNVPSASDVAKTAPVAPVVSSEPLEPTAPKTASINAAPVAAAPAPLAPQAKSAANDAAPAMAPVSVAPAPSEANDPRIDALMARVDSLQNALNQANQQINQMTNMVAASASTAPAPAAVPKDVQDRIDRLEQQLADMRQAQNAAPSVTSSPQPAAAMPHTTYKTAAAPVTHHKQAHKVTHKTTKPVVTEAENNWVLRAASPGQAWVASSSTSRDLMQIQVGDTLPGVGRVTAIQQQGDRWVVKGTKGSVQ